MENNSLSPTLPASPTTFPPDAFRPWPTIGVLLGLIVAAFVGAIIAVFIYIIAVHADTNALRHPSVGFVLGIQAVFDIIAALFLALVLPALARTTLEGIGFRVPDSRTIGIALIGAVAMVVVVNGLGSLIEVLTHSKHQQEAIKLLLSVRDPNIKLAFALVAVVIAPISEELAFRVFVFNAVRHHWGFWAGAIVSGIFFGLAHLDAYAFVPLVFGGIILCAVYAATRNAWASMMTHGLFNAVSVIALYFAPQLAR